MMKLVTSSANAAASASRFSRPRVSRRSKSSMSLGHVMGSGVASVFFREDPLDLFGFGAVAGTSIEYRKPDRDEDPEHRHYRPHHVEVVLVVTCEVHNPNPSKP